MSEEEKKIKEMDELGVELVDSPSEIVAKTSPTKLKLQAITFMIIGKIESYYLNKMLNQAREAQNLASVGLKSVTTMNDLEKQIFMDKVTSNVTLLEKQVDLFNESFQRVIARGKRSLKLPKTNLGILRNKALNSKRRESIVGAVDAYKQMNDIFATAKKDFDGMVKPVKRDIEISEAEQESIRKSVYEALNKEKNKEIQDYATKFNDKQEKQLEEKLDGVINEITGYKKVNNTNKEKKLDNFFDNISPSKYQSKLEKKDLDEVLNGGKVKGQTDKEPKKTDEYHPILTADKPIFSSVSTEQAVSDGLIIPEWLQNSQKGNSSIFDDVKPIIDITPKHVAKEEDVLADSDIEEYTIKFTDDKKDYIEEAISDNQVVPDVEDLSRQLEESIREREQKRLAKEEARKKYETEKQAREREEKELSESKKELKKMKEENERKKEEQKALDELNQKVKKALEYQKQIEENRRAALKEEEETRKYQESLRTEKENQDKVLKEREQLRSEKAALQSETTEVDSSLKEKKEKLQEIKRQLQSFNNTNEPSMFTKKEIYEGNITDYYATPTRRNR